MHEKSFHKLAHNFFRLDEGGDFRQNVDAENQTLINHKFVCGALNRNFCQTRYMGLIVFSLKLRLSPVSPKYISPLPVEHNTFLEIDDLYAGYFVCFS